jgi:Uma2 family endonuclease
MVTAAHPTARTRTAPGRRLPLLPLVNGDHLTSAEFLRRYEAMPELKKAELIDGIVYMPPPVSADTHAEPDNVLQYWLRSYAILHPGLRCYANPTLVLDADNTPQPDAVLCPEPRAGGRVWLNEKRYLCGAPELVCEVAASSVSIDLNSKLHAYRRAGVQEYLVWATLDQRVCWYRLVAGEYIAAPERSGRLESAVFPGLMLPLKALLAFDCGALAAALQKPRRRR